MRKNNAGAGIGLALWGMILLAFPPFAGMSGWTMRAFYAVGLLVLLIGVMGACIELFGGSKE